MTRNLARGIAITAASVVCLTGCAIPDKKNEGVGLRNDTDTTVTIERLQDGKHLAVQTLKPGASSLATADGLVAGKCVEDVGLRAVDPVGQVMATLAAVCDGETWIIQSAGKSAVMGLNGSTTAVRP